MGNVKVNAITRTPVDQGGGNWGSVGAGVTPPSGLWRANEPAGMTSLEERTYDTLSEAGWWKKTESSPYFQLATQNSPAPVHGSSSVGQMYFPAGFTGGGAPTSDGIDLSNSAIWNVGSEEVYVCFEVLFSSNWQPHPTGTNKIFFITMSAQNGNGDPSFLSLQTNAAAGPQIQVRNQGTGDFDPPVLPLLSEEVITYGEWNLVEVRLKASSTPTTSDGAVQLWINGVKTQEDLACVWASTAGAKWDTVKFEPTWGGGGSTVVSDMYQQVSRIYVGAST
jgi:hypothetical protein